MPSKFLRVLILSLLMGGLLAGCEEEPGPNDPAAIRDNFLGQWLVNENMGQFAPQTYTVEIVAGAENDEMVLEGLYNFPATRVTVVLNGLDWIIPNQTTGSVNFVGNGTSNTSYDQIALSFTANDGSGPDNVEAVLVP
jgi:hypothetical protein